MSAAARGPEAYARALERALSRIRERPVVLSPRDWALVVEWHAREIPLAVILEALDEAASRGRARGSGSGPRSLAYIARAVNEDWELIASGRRDRAASSEIPVPSFESVRSSWESLAESLPSGRSELAALLRELLRRLDAGEAASAVDDELDRRIADCLPRSEVAAVELQVEEELAPFRRRLPPPALQQTRARSISRRLRRSLGLPRLSMSAR